MTASDSAVLPQFDVVVVGFGPVGQTLAILLARRGHRVAAVERWGRGGAARRHGAALRRGRRPRPARGPGRGRRRGPGGAAHGVLGRGVRRRQQLRPRAHGHHPDRPGLLLRLADLRRRRARAAGMGFDGPAAALLADLEVSVVRLVADGDGNGTVDLDGAMVEHLRRSGLAAVLVRPDGYVFGGAAQAADLPALLARLGSALGLRSPSVVAAG